MRPSLNDIALERYGCPFHHLSAFGQREILAEWNGRDEEMTMRHVDLAQALYAAQEKISKLEQENRDLWEDNEELQLRLFEYEDSNSWDTRQRQARARVRTDETSSAVPAEASGFGIRTDNEDI